VKYAHRLIFGSKRPPALFLVGLLLAQRCGPGLSEAHQKIVDRIVDFVHSGMKLFQVLSLREEILPNFARAVWKYGRLGMQM